MHAFAVFTIVALLLSQYEICSALKRIEAPCAACKAVARELQARISKEKDRQPVDLRGRLDSTGKRYGRVIEYKNSELRAVELLDGLCNVLKTDYSLVTSNDTDGQKVLHWVKYRGDNPDSLVNVTRPTRDEEEVLGKRLESYCGSLIEEYEEEIYEGIMQGGFDDDGVEVHLCRRIITPCPKKAAVLTDAGVAAADNAADRDEL